MLQPDGHTLVWTAKLLFHREERFRFGLWDVRSTNLVYIEPTYAYMSSPSNMDSKLFSTLFTIPFLLILYITPCLAQVVPSDTPVARDSICNDTLYRGYCMSVISSNGSQSVYNYSRSVVIKSFLYARNLYILADKYLANHSNLSSSMSGALEDCKDLAGLSMDYLWTTSTRLNYTMSLQSSQAEDLQTLLSATLTNAQTCLDEIDEAAASSVSNGPDGLYTALLNTTQIYSISLSIFSCGLVINTTTGSSAWFLRRKLLFSDIMKIGRNNELLFRMSRSNREILESVSKRRLLQTSDSVLILETVTVSQDGSGNYTTISDAVDAAPDKKSIENGYFLIYVTAGVYEEYVTIAKNQWNLMMVGDGINQTIITGNHSVGGGYTTFNSPTMAVVGEGFVGRGITIRNTAGASNHQAVALRNGADLSAFYLCSFEGYQDTLYTHSLRQFYRECDIYGTVDFIFGNAAVVLQNCNIYPRLPLVGQYNTLTAQGKTDPNQNTGTSIHNCTITAAADLAASSQTVLSYLGRPWKAYSTTVYMQSYMDSVIYAKGWHDWDVSFESTLYYAEYNNTGSGSSTDDRVTWSGYHVINASDASSFTVSNFIYGNIWLNATGVPYTSGLI